MIGTTVGHYKILEKLGEGGMGVVYKAEDQKLRRTVALKFLPSYITKESIDNIRFLQEAQAISALNHPNISTIHYLEEVNGQNFIVLEYIDGGTLKEKVRGKQLPINEVLVYAIQISEGLSHAHQKNIIHRDIKTDNIMLTSDGRLKITDFGLAKLLGAVKVTRTGSTVGTAAYMSPEQARGDEVDHRSDIFSLGIVLYEMTSGALPFNGMHEAALLYEIVNQKQKPLSMVRSDVPAELEHIVDKAMEKKVEDRYQNMEEMLSDLIDMKTAITSGEMIKRKRSGKIRYKWIAVSTLLAALLSVVYFLIYPLTIEITSKEVPSIAILYLKNLGQENDEAYVYGITQDLIIDVAKAGIIRVTPMKDILSLQGTNLTIDKIAQQLRVKYIFDGTFKKDVDRFQFSAQIIEATTGKTIWADRIQTRFSESPQLQGRLAQAIFNALNISTSTIAGKNLTTSRTTNPEAYEYYLRAKYIYEKKKNKDDINIARGMYEKSINLDSTFIFPKIGLGLIYEARGEFTSAQQIYQHALLIARSSDNKLDEADCLVRLGVVQLDLSSFQKALDYFQQSAIIYRESDDRFGESITLNNIGAVYTYQGNIAKSIESYKQSLNIIQTLDDREEESRLLNNLGVAYQDQGDYAASLEVLNKCLKIKKEIEDRRGEGNALSNLGSVYLELGEYQKAFDFDTLGLAIHRRLGNRPFEAQTLGDLGEIYSSKGEIDKALSYYVQSIDLFRILGDRLSEGIMLTRIGKIFCQSQKLQRGIDSLKTAVNIFEQIKETQNLISSLSLLAFATMKSNNQIEAKNITRKIEELLKTNNRGSIYIKTTWYLYKTYALLGERSAADHTLNDGYNELNIRATKIQAAETRLNYLNNVRENFDIKNTWEKMHQKK